MRERGRTFSSNGMQTLLFCPAAAAAVLARGLSTLCLGLFALAREEEEGEDTRYSFSHARIPTACILGIPPSCPWLHTLSLINGK